MPFIYYIEIALIPSIDAPHHLGLHLRTRLGLMWHLTRFNVGQARFNMRLGQVGQVRFTRFCIVILLQNLQNLIKIDSASIDVPKLLGLHFRTEKLNEKVPRLEVNKGLNECVTVRNRPQTTILALTPPISIYKDFSHTTFELKKTYHYPIYI